MQRNRASESPKPLKVRVQGVAPKVTVKMVAVEEDTSMQLFSMRERERESKLELSVSKEIIFGNKLEAKWNSGLLLADWRNLLPTLSRCTDVWAIV